MTESEKYDIKWTIPHCVLTLRLIGQAFDAYDGQKKEVSFYGFYVCQLIAKCPCHWG
jgi:hypothetical protein